MSLAIISLRALAPPLALASGLLVGTAAPASAAVPAVCAPATAAALAAAVDTANVGGCTDNTITLQAGATYTFGSASSSDGFYGDTALPVVTGTVSIVGNGATIERSSAADTPAFRLMTVTSGSLSISDAVLRNGLTPPTQSGSSRGFGGCFLSYGSLSLVRSSLMNCSATDNGSVLTSTGPLVLDRSTIVPGPRAPGVNQSSLTTAGRTLLRNSTVDGVGRGLTGLYSYAGEVSLVNSTLTGFLSPVAILDSAHASVVNTIAVGSSYGVFAGRGGTWTDGGHNILEGDPQLGPTQDNGGPTPTRALLPNSPAINAGDADVCASADGVAGIDQRGVSRTKDKCDIGAYELAPAATGLSTSSASGAPGQTTTLTATLTRDDIGVPGESIDFTLGGSSVGSATTNASGVATLSDVSLAGYTTGSHPDEVSASFAGDSPFGASSDTDDLDVSKLTQTITLTDVPGSADYGTTFNPHASSSSGLPVSLGASGPCSLSTTTSQVKMTSGSGSCVVTASQSGSTTYESATTSQTVTATKAAQTVTFGTLGDKIYGAPSFTVSSASSSGQPVTFTATTPSVCTVSGATVAVVGVGTCTVKAAAPGDANYRAAPDVTRSFVVAYRVCLLYSPQAQVKTPGSTMPIKLQLCDANGRSVSSASLTATALDVDGKPGLLSGSKAFTFASGAYQYNLRVPTSGLLPGKQHYLSFTVAGDTTTVYRAPFVTK